MISISSSRTRLVQVCRILIVEDDDERVAKFRSWLPETMRIVHARSAGSAIGILQRDKGRVYAGIMLDHDLQL